MHLGLFNLIFTHFCLSSSHIRWLLFFCRRLNIFDIWFVVDRMAPKLKHTCDNYYWNHFFFFFLKSISKKTHTMLGRALHFFLKEKKKNLFETHITHRANNKRDTWKRKTKWTTTKIKSNPNKLKQEQKKIYIFSFSSKKKK